MLRDKLSKLDKHFGSSGKKEKEEKEETEYNRYRIAQKILGGETCDLTSGTFLKIESNFNSEYKHGNLTINQLTEFAPCRYSHFERYGGQESVDPERLLFFDIETTGLGGSGTVPFLIGFGSVIGDSFQVRQYFLPDYPDEAAMLEAVREEIDENTIIVSYNGKSFDMPILVDRMIINRVDRNLKFSEHIDLLHSARRLYRRRLRSCTLSNIERNILDFQRFGDVPGELVPAVYFNWLNSMGTELLGQVVEHNLNDIVSLYFLMYHIALAQENPGDRLTDADDIYSVARIFEKRKEHDKVSQTLTDCRQIISDNNRYDILFMQSLACKRTGRFDEAVSIWTDIAGKSNAQTFLALIELAKYYEHREKNYTAALECSQKAQKICPARRYDRDDIARRMIRLERKLTK